MAGMGDYRSRGDAAMARTAIVKLNGGLGTTMGLHEPKSLIEVKGGLSFLDITILQVLHFRERGCKTMPLLLMNSFFTDAAIRRFLAAHRTAVQEAVHCFTQHKFPRIRPQTLEPVSRPQDPSLEWNPAGHGDLFLSLQTSGLLDKLERGGFEYLFVSNIDNLGAQLDPCILGFFAAEGLDFLMEVTDRTHMDRKGGHLARLKNGRFALRESSQCAAEDAASFADIVRHPFFNTNNLWLNLKSVRRFLAGRKNLDLPPVVSLKRLVPEDSDSPAVMHCETALGSAISLFEKSAALRVPRSRFAPVKNCDELLLLWSDYYELTDEYCLRPNETRRSRPISLALDPAFYSRIDLLRERFPHGAPSLIQCDAMSIKGDVRFGRDVALRGTVAIANSHESQAVIADNAVLSGDYSL
jgi:UTP--glucose-1-phosphate uridylyltransferase